MRFHCVCVTSLMQLGMIWTSFLGSTHLMKRFPPSKATHGRNWTSADSSVCQEMDFSSSQWLLLC